MISDVLFEAIREIEMYQREFSEAYDAMRDELDVLKRVLDAFGSDVDTPPPFDSVTRSLTQRLCTYIAAFPGWELIDG